MARGMPPLQFANISRMLDMNAWPLRMGATGRSKREEKPRLCLSNRLIRYDKAGSKNSPGAQFSFLKGFLTHGSFKLAGYSVSGGYPKRPAGKPGEL